MWEIYAFLSALFAALTAILAKVGMKGVDSNLATAIRTIVIVVLAWAIVFMSGKHNDIASLTKKNWLFLSLSGIATGLSWIFYYKAISQGKVSQVSLIDKSSIVLTLLLSFFILGEQFDLKTVIASVLIVSGIFIMIWK
ncbi:transporter family protein [Clostridium cavendishii DSM 21758]|uniref:Transporter family protein n=1 Tax=Clostridium cavendishii DSM 21758 TaxID=1121302 RepID=A0A1M6I041_9CLOT|nr:EamA family transporter [Clostridium cavendishii]SHJ27842.1 transporter family protein [Clostridium cavendishii DSM 21758]